MTTQFRNYFATAGMPVDLVVGADTVVAGPLRSAIVRSGVGERFLSARPKASLMGTRDD
jgi:hypothetical protein